MLRETYYNRYKGWGEKPPSDAVVINITRDHGHMLSPSYELLMDYKQKRITWEEYIVRFKEEMNNDACKMLMKRIKTRASEVDVYLVCYCFNKEKRCHRFLLMDMIKNL